MRKLLITLCFIFFIIGCRKEVSLEGFAFYTKVPSPYLYKGISPEGIIIQASKKKNYPEIANIRFWEDAIKTYLPQRGYKLIKDGLSGNGKFFIFMVPGVKYDYFYFIHYIIKDEKITLTEAGGKFAYLKEYEDRIIKFCEIEL